ncbi:LysR family transcriptional regulator [Thalassotalea psychrophila]|uniref:LysR family transcriptional regulator n=1 Tax=Thalassotalea psychrophila TaxID=3065647 RepID=A0ABY9TTR8_9GAMM|nr:LysR family transcriptional regulator [Colwelliaceae bacterium SQ149]
MNLDLKQLRYFSAVVEHNSFRKAADSLFISQPALSLAIKELERRLGVALLERGAGKIIATEYGKVLLKGSVEIKGCVQQTLDELDHIRGIHSGQVNFGISPVVATSELGTILGKFVIKYPNINILTDHSLYHWSVQKLLQGELDFFISEVPPYGEDKNVICHHLFDMHYGFICGVEHSLANKTVELAEAMQYRLAYGKDWAAEVQGWAQSFAKNGLQQPESYLNVSTSEFYVNLLAHSQVIALTPLTRYIKERIENNELAQIHIKHTIWHTTAALVCRKNQRFSPAAELLCEEVKQQVPQLFKV